LGIRKWIVFGAAGASTLALAYAINTQQSAGVVLRGEFFLSQKEIDWFYQRVKAIFIPMLGMAILHQSPRMREAT